MVLTYYKLSKKSANHMMIQTNTSHGNEWIEKNGKKFEKKTQQKHIDNKISWYRIDIQVKNINEISQGL